MTDARISSRGRSDVRQIVHCVGALVALALCALAAAAAVRAGVSRVYSEYSSAENSLAAAKSAVEFNPADAEAHYAYGLRLSDANKNNEAIAELERATSLRPNDYFLWQELGRFRDEAGGRNGAVTTFDHREELAPNYPQPPWPIGNVPLT